MELLWNAMKATWAVLCLMADDAREQAARQDGYDEDGGYCRPQEAQEGGAPAQVSLLLPGYHNGYGTTMDHTYVEPADWHAQ